MMSQPTPIRPDLNNAEAALPKSEIRTAVSFLLFLHFFAIGVMIVGTERSSDLGAALAQVPGIKQYREGLMLIMPYSYYLTRGMMGGELDVDHTLIANVKFSDGSEEEVLLPEPGTWPGQRLHRYQTLARNVAIFGDETIGMPELSGLLVQSIARSILEREQEKGAQSLQLRCRGRLTLPAMADFDPDNLPQRERYREAYTTTAFKNGDQFELLKKDPARDTAPPPKDP
jgi:hypothetical protein